MSFRLFEKASEKHMKQSQTPSPTMKESLLLKISILKEIAKHCYMGLKAFHVLKFIAFQTTLDSQIIISHISLLNGKILFLKHQSNSGQRELLQLFGGQRLKLGDPTQPLHLLFQFSLLREF